MPRASIHRGSYDSIPPTASPGLLFLRDFLPALDFLQPSQNHVSRFLAPDAIFVIGSSPAMTANKVLPMLDMRSERLVKFHHEMAVAWDIEQDGDDSGNDRRTVMYESSSITVFKNDPEKVEVRVKEFNIVELERSRKGDEEGDQLDFSAVELRTYMDATPVKERAEKMKA